MGGGSKFPIWDRYLKHLIELWPGDWFDQLSKMNEESEEINRHQKATGKRRLVQHFQTTSSVNLLRAFYRQLR